MRHFNSKHLQKVTLWPSLSSWIIAIAVSISSFATTKIAWGAQDIAIFTGITTVGNGWTNSVGIYTYPDTSYGDSSLQRFTIKNVGNVNLTSLNVSLAGANTADFDWSGPTTTTLAPGATTFITVRFKPSTTGTRNATVIVGSNDPDESLFAINMRGNGTAMQIESQPVDYTACPSGSGYFYFSVGDQAAYQWQRKNPGSSTFANVAGATNRDLYISPATGADDGAVYRAIATKGASSMTSAEAVLYVDVAVGPEWQYNFSSVNIGGAAIYGDAVIAGGVLQLNPAQGSTMGAFLTPELAPQSAVRGFTATFKVQMISGNGYADGFSFNWSDNLGPGAYGAEQGYGGGLSVCFDTFEPASEGGNQAVISVKWNYETIASYPLSNDMLPGTGNDFADVAIRLYPNGTLDVFYRCIPIFLKLPIPGFTPLMNSRIGLGSRTGFYYESHAIDDLMIHMITSLPVLDQCVPEDLIVGTSTNSPVTQGPTKAFDNDITSKYLNFDKLDAGLIIAASGKQAIRAITFISAEDAPDRDPSSFVLESSGDGVNFSALVPGTIPAFPTRHYIQTVPITTYGANNVYRLRFPTVSNAMTANSMQIAEVELHPYPEITSSNDMVSISLPPGAVDVRGVHALFDRQLDSTNKLEIAPFTSSNVVVVLTPALGRTVLKGFELIGAADDFTYPFRRPRNVTVAGSNDGINFTNLATVVPQAPKSNLQIQEFSTSQNSVAFAQYRITFGIAASGDRIQVGEMRLFGDVAPPLPPPVLSIHPNGGNVQISWTNVFGFALEAAPALSGSEWSPVGVVPVLSNGLNTVTLPGTAGASFFRLRK